MNNKVEESSITNTDINPECAMIKKISAMPLTAHTPLHSSRPSRFVGNGLRNNPPFRENRFIVPVKL